VIVTTSRNASKHAKKFANEFATLIPTGEYYNRRTFEVKQMLEFAVNREYTDVIIINENKKKINQLVHCHLPNGPTAKYRLSSIQYGKEVAPLYFKPK
jgi:ribosome production factor 1